jgi:hypothetical protein
VHRRKASERPLSPGQLEVLRVGAVSSGLAGVSWKIGARSVGPAVRGCKIRGLIRFAQVDHLGHPALMTIPTTKGELALEEIDRGKISD